MKIKIVLLVVTMLFLTSCRPYFKGNPFPVVGNDAAKSYYYAIGAGNFEAVESFIENGMDPDKINLFTVGVNGVNSLRIAFNYGDKNMVKKLLDLGADPNYTDSLGISQLMWVSGVSHTNRDVVDIEYVRLLLQYGANVAPVNRGGIPALDYAAKAGETEIFDLLLEYGGAVSKKTFPLVWKQRDSVTYFGIVNRVAKESLSADIALDIDPILEAAVTGDTVKTKTLVQQDGLNESNADLVLHYTAAFGTAETLELIWAKSAELTGLKLSDLLYPAALYNNLDVVQYLLQYVYVDEGSFRGRAAFPIAVEHNYYDLAKYLLEQGAEVNPETGDTLSSIVPPMESAVQTGNLEMVKLLLDYDYPLDEDTVNFMMAQAISNRSNDIFEYFVELSEFKGFTVDKQYLLRFACYNGNMDAIIKLMDLGANLNQTDAKGEAALFFSVSAYQPETVSFLIDNGAVASGYNGEKAALEAAGKGYFDILKILIGNGANVDCCEEDFGRSLLMKGVFTSTRMTEYLIEHNASLNLQDQDGNTALMLAAESGRTENVHLLLENGADPNVNNNDGKTAYELAQENKHQEIAKLIKTYLD